MATTPIVAPPSPAAVAAAGQSRRDQIRALRAKATRSATDSAQLMNLIADEVLASSQD